MKTAAYAEHAEIFSARICATAGAAIWAGIALLAHFGRVPVGAIELLFLFAALVIVPLGMELQRVVLDSALANKNPERWSTRLGYLSRIALPFGAAMAVLALMLPPGTSAGLLALGWMSVCLLLASAGVADLVFNSSLKDSAPGRASLVNIAVAIARIDLAVGGAWFVASRFGMRPMGIQEPIGVLTAVHFHFAGFATATIAATALHFAASRRCGAWLKWIVLFVVGMPFLVAAGFVISPMMKVAAAVIFSVSVAALAISLRSLSGRTESKTARVFLDVAAVSVFLGMMLSGVYAIADFRGSDVLPIPQMARTHGVLNALGFCLSGLLGWLIELNPAFE